MLLSVIIPCYNEHAVLRATHERLTAVLKAMNEDYELIFVDDGSRDTTARIGAEIAREDPRVRFVKFRRNYGQTPAMAAGIEHARGEVLVTMDGDLQNDPADVGILLAKIHEGYDILVALILHVMPAGHAVRLQDFVTAGGHPGRKSAPTPRASTST